MVEIKNIILILQNNITVCNHVHIINDICNQKITKQVMLYYYVL